MYETKKPFRPIPTLTGRMFRANRGRNLVAVLAILLTTVMFTTLFTLTQSMRRNLVEMTFRQTGYDAQASLRGLSEEQADRIAGHPDVVELGRSIVLGLAENRQLTGQSVEIRWANDAYARHSFASPTAGRMPEAADEIALDTLTLDRLGVSHELLILSESQTERIDQEIQTYQNGILNAYSSAFTQVKNLQTELDTVLEEEGATIEVGTTVTYENPVSEAVKFAIIGLVLGAFLAAFVLVVVYLMSGKLQSTDSFREEFGMPLLGQITKHPHKKRLFGFIDNWFQRIEEGAYADITYEEQLKIAAANLKTAASKEQGLKKVMLAGTMSKDEAEAFRSMLAAELDGIELSSYERIVFQASALEELDSYDGVVFLEKKGASYAKLIKKERDLVADRDVRILGVVVL